MCKCGCNTCGNSAPMLKEGVSPKLNLSEALKYHIKEQIPLYENMFRIGSDKYFELIREARILYKLGQLTVDEGDRNLLETDLGEFGYYEGQVVPLDMPMVENEINEAKYQGKEVQLNKPKRGGSKKFYVYVRDPKTKNIKKVSFGAAGGGQKLSVKFKDSKARKAFADRHNCSSKKDRTKAGYWSCNLPRYAKSLGLGSNMNTFW